MAPVFYSDLLIRLLSIAVVVALSAAETQAQRTLGCEAPFGQGERKEQAFLQRAPHGASRLSKHQLTVGWAGGTARFVDKAPYMEGEQAGSRYLYCGFSPELAMHLIYYAHDELSEGLLLDDRNGKRLPAGDFVAFSPRNDAYFIARQPDGLDGQEWRLYSRDGKVLWKGLSGIEARKEWTYFVATLKAPRWNDRGELQATLTCTVGNQPHLSATVTLVHQQSAWRWLPVVDCPKA